MQQHSQPTPAEADWLNLKSQRTLAQHAREIRTSPAPGDLWAATETTLGTLRKLAEFHKTKRGQIEALIAKCAP